MKFALTIDACNYLRKYLQAFLITLAGGGRINVAQTG